MTAKRARWECPTGERPAAIDRAVRVARFPMWTHHPSGPHRAHAVYRATSERTSLRWSVYSLNAGLTWRADVNGKPWGKTDGSARWWRSAEAAMTACERRDSEHSRGPGRHNR